jgi:hypothetical protein
LTLPIPVATIPTQEIQRVASSRQSEGGLGMAAQTGKRYTCPKCGSEFIVTKGGDGELMCGDTPLELKK